MYIVHIHMYIVHIHMYIVRIYAYQQVANTLIVYLQERALLSKILKNQSKTVIFHSSFLRNAGYSEGDHSVAFESSTV